jgi:hypothetical protein
MTNTAVPRTERGFETERAASAAPPLRAAVIAIALLIAALVLTGSPVRAQPVPAVQHSADALEEMAREHFGALSHAEVVLLRSAPQRLLASAGPSRRAEDPANDPRHAGGWGAERVIRAALLAWLVSDPAAAPYVHPSGAGIMAARIAGRLDLSYQSIGRPLSLVQCALPDGIDLSYAHLQSLDLRGSSTGPIDAQSATTVGDISLLYGHYGATNLYRAAIGGTLDLTGSEIEIGDGTALSAIEAEIGGDALFQDGFTTDGMVDFRLARVRRSLSFSSARFMGRYRNGLNAERARIDGILYWYEIQHTALTVLDLKQATAAELWDDRASWPAPGNLLLDGFTYQGFGAGSLWTAPERLQWLALQPPGYRPQPFTELAQALRQEGRVDGAMRVLIAQRAAQRRSGIIGPPERIWNLLLEYTIGYGFLPLRALWWMSGFVLFGTIVFGLGYRWGVITPTEEGAYREFVEKGAAPRHYPPFNAFVYSLENFLPVVDLCQGNFWRPNPLHPPVRPGGKAERAGVITGRFLRWYLWMHILAGWILTPLLAAGLSGLIRVD